MYSNLVGTPDIPLRVLVILPSDPIRDREVRKGGDQKQYEVLVVGVFDHDFQNEIWRQ